MHKLVNGVQVALTPEEIKEFKAMEKAHRAGAKDRLLADIRVKRDELLKESDPMILSDHPVTDKEAVKAYRQALRDITDQKNLKKIVWPVKPGKGE